MDRLLIAMRQRGRDSRGRLGLEARLTDVTCTFRTLGDLVLRAGITQGEIAHKLGFRNRVSVHRKINGQRKWYYDELVKLGAMLRAKNISVKIDTLVLLAGEGQVVIRSRTVKPGEVTDD